MYNRSAKPTLISNPLFIEELSKEKENLVDCRNENWTLTRDETMIMMNMRKEVILVVR